MSDPTLQERLRTIASFKCGADKIQLILCYSEAKDGCREAAARIDADAERFRDWYRVAADRSREIIRLTDRVAELELESETDAERIRDFKHIQASYVVDKNAANARIALLEAVAEAGRSLPASMNQGYPPIDTALAALDAAKEPRP